MIPIAQYLPKAYFQPLPTGMKRADAAEQTKTQFKQNPEQIIEAEWRPLNEARLSPPYVYQPRAALLSDSSELPQASTSPAHAAARYQEMTPGPQPQPGILLDTLV